MMAMVVQDILVRKSIVVNAPREHVFRTSTERFDHVVAALAPHRRTRRVELEHRKLHRYGEKAETMRAVFEGENAWAGLLKAMASEAERSAES